MKKLEAIPLLLLFIGSAAWSLPASYDAKENAIPSICESCYPAYVRWGGKPHCAPAAVSNSLVWLSQNGYPTLQPFQGAERDVSPINQARLVNLLGDAMGTTEESGTSPFHVLLGLKNYLGEKKVRFTSIAAEGWRTVPDFVINDGTVVDLDWIKAGTLGKNSAWLLIGWYRYDSKTDDYQIFAGHWVTVVGYGKDASGRLDPAILIVHDPAERAKARANYYVRVDRLTHGRLLDNGKNPSPPRDASGVLSLTGDLVFKETATHAIVQGAYRLNL